MSYSIFKILFKYISIFVKSCQAKTLFSFFPIQDFLNEFDFFKVHTFEGFPYIREGFKKN